jgi:CarD family transcriptional regulator
VVSGIATRRVAEAVRAYYQVEFPNGTSRAYVPVDALSRVGMRLALTQDEMPQLLFYLRTGRVQLPRQWAARHRKVTEILVGGDPYEIATLASELRQWSRERGLPDLDRQAYRRAIKLLAQEIQEISGSSADDVRVLLESAWDEEPN